MAYLGGSIKFKKCRELLLKVAAVAAISPAIHAATIDGPNVDGPLAIIMKKAAQEQEKSTLSQAAQEQKIESAPSKTNDNRFAILSDNHPAPVIATSTPPSAIDRDTVLNEQATPAPILATPKVATPSQFDLPITPDVTAIPKDVEAPFDIRKTVRSWQISDKDTTLEDVLQRWTKTVGWHLVWSYPSEVSITSPSVEMSGTMTMRVFALLHSLRELPTELMATFYTENKVLRITAKD